MDSLIETPTQSCPQLTDYVPRSISSPATNGCSPSEDLGSQESKTPDSLSSRSRASSFSTGYRTPKKYSTGSREMLERFKRLVVLTVDYLTLSRKSVIPND